LKRKAINRDRPFDSALSPFCPSIFFHFVMSGFGAGTAFGDGLWWVLIAESNV
jgi:hypothetical protein